jgi:hypothetical protein
MGRSVGRSYWPVRRFASLASLAIAWAVAAGADVRNALAASAGWRRFAGSWFWLASKRKNHMYASQLRGSTMGHSDHCRATEQTTGGAPAWPHLPGLGPLCVPACASSHTCLPHTTGGWSGAVGGHARTSPLTVSLVGCRGRWVGFVVAWLCGRPGGRLPQPTDPVASAPGLSCAVWLAWPLVIDRLSTRS